MSRILDRRMMVDELRSKVRLLGGAEVAAREWCVPQRDVETAMAGVMAPTADILRAIGLREEVTYIAEP